VQHDTHVTDALEHAHGKRRRRVASAREHAHRHKRVASACVNMHMLSIWDMRHISCAAASDMRDVRGTRDTACDTYETCSAGVIETGVGAITT
jgi:hypothetical protein